ncbi:hypothetical protein Q7P37_002470 [Cladosporium fusiforme]
MSKRTLFTSITPLPKDVTRQAAVAWLHNHVQMIKLNPLVIRLQETTPPSNASADEFDCAWYEITDEISYLPGGLYKGEVTYKACFNDLPNGIQTHTFAPAGLDLRGKWSVCGNEPGEPREPLELGTEAPREGLYIREDVDMRCNILLTGFIKKNLTKSHKSVVDKLSELGHSPSTTGEDNGLAPPSDGYVQPPHQMLTPVDGNTVFGPDSYSTEYPSAQYAGSPPASKSQPELGVPSGFHVGQYQLANSQQENPRSHPRSRTPSLEVARDHHAPQIPPLNFSYPGSLPNNRDSGSDHPNFSYRASYQQTASPTAKARSDLELSKPRSVLHDPSIQAELSAEKSPVKSAYGEPLASDTYGRDSLQPRLDVSQRVSTDYTWRPGLKPGAFI